MKYDIKAFNDAVKYYETSLKQFKAKTFLVVFDVNNEKGFFSLAPFSRAAHNLKCDLNVNLIGDKAESIEALMDVWKVFDELQRKELNEKTIALDEFIKEVDKKAKGEFRKIFPRPEVLVFCDEKQFILNGEVFIDMRPEWFKKYRWGELLETGKVIWSQVYDLKKNEKVGMGFDLIMPATFIKNPLEDYFDSYAIARTMFLSCPAEKKTMKSSTNRKTMLEKGERIGELSATLLGCELEKEIDEPVFKKFRKLSALLRLDRFKTNTATFFAKGEGYGGKHLFGETIGYPTPNKKSRWDGPSGIIYQFAWSPQTKIDGRGPKCRVGFTDTLPIDIYIESCRIDWLKMKKIDDALIALVNKSDKIFVESEKSKFEVGLIKKDRTHRLAMNSDVDIGQCMTRTPSSRESRQATWQTSLAEKCS